MSIPAIILAAGESKRLGRPKQLLNVAGTSLLRRLVVMTLANCHPVIVVLGSQAEVISVSLSGLPVIIAVNMCWQEGIASSIRVGIDTLPVGAIGAMLLVCDQVALTKEVFIRFVATCCEHPKQIVACSYDHTCGVPAYFPSTYFTELKALKGDRGASGIIASYGSSTVTVAFPDGTMDIDYREDVLDYLEYSGHS